MKRCCIAALVLWCLLLACPVLAEGAFDPAGYDREELLAMHAAITTRLYEGQADSVLYDENGIRVELWGVSKEYSNSPYLDMHLLVVNSNDERLSITLEDLLVNRCSVAVNHRWFGVEADSVYLASSTAGPEFKEEYLERYRITQIERLDFTLKIEMPSREEPLLVPLTALVEYAVGSE